MRIVIDKTGTVDGFKMIFNEMVSNNDIKGIIILACDNNEFTPELVDNILIGSKIPVFGGIFPAIIHMKEKMERGTIIAGLSFKPEVHIINELSDNSIEYEDILEEKIKENSNVKTMFVLVDGFAKRISALIESLFFTFGLEFNYIGGGAGSLSLKQKPCLFTNKGLVMDCAILLLTEMRSGVGVSHGWSDVEGPFKVTESDRNVIKTLDWEPAFDLYRKIVEKHSNKKFEKDSFFDLAKSYPFGIAKLGAEKIVRDPLMLGDNGELICVGEVPEGSFIHILNGNTNSLVEASSEAFEIGKSAYPDDSSFKTVFFIDCISRVLFLEDDFKKEINSVFQKNIPLIGALTIGEIANSGQDYLEFYNKTAVVGVLED